MAYGIKLWVKIWTEMLFEGYNFQQEKGKKMVRAFHAWLQRRYGSGHHQMAKDMDGLTIVAGNDLKMIKKNGYPVYPSLEECKEEADVVVDFASPKAADHLWISEKKGLVLCTTGAF